MGGLGRGGSGIRVRHRGLGDEAGEWLQWSMGLPCGPGQRQGQWGEGNEAGGPGVRVMASSAHVHPCLVRRRLAAR